MTNERSISNRKDGRALARRELCAAASLVGLGLIAWPGTLLAGAVIDRSWGRTPQTLSGHFVVPEAKGKLAGTNLFHSFQRFSIGASESATFTTSTNTIQNVISRVTGNAASSINGPLSLQAAAGSAPNFFFINPNGVTFGPGAQVNVPASFHVSTASNLRFADGTVFRAGAGSDNTLTVAAPEAFGFLGGNGRIAFNGVQADGSAGNAAFAASSLDVSAADIRMDNSSVSIPNADVRLVATGTGKNRVPLAGTPVVRANGRVILRESTLDVSTSGRSDGGVVTLYGNEIRLDAATLRADSTGTFGEAGDIYIDGDSVFVMGRSLLSAQSLEFGTGGAGSIRIRAGGVVTVAPKSGAVDGTTITNFSRSGNPNQTGVISIAGKSVILVNATISSRNTETKTGSISIASESNMTLRGTSISAPGDIAGGGVAGTIMLSSTHGDISIKDSTVGTGPTPGGSGGSAGVIGVSSAGKVLLDNGHLFATARDLAISGTIEVDAAQIVLRNNSELSATHLGGTAEQVGGQGRVGSIRLTASNDITIDGSSVVEARNLAFNFRNPDQIVPGTIQLTTPTLILDGRITTESTGNLLASSIIVAAPLTRNGAHADLAVKSKNGQGVISASVSNSAPSCTACGAGAAGLVRIEGGSLSLAGVKVLSEAGPNSTGQAGSIAIKAAGAASIKQSLISANSAGQGNAGSVSVTAGDRIAFDKSVVSAGAASSNGGTISSVSGRKLTLDNSLFTTSVSGSTGNAGNIDVTAETVALRTGFIQANTVAAGASGGDITITARSVTPVGKLEIGGNTPVEFQPGRGKSVIQSAAPLGIPGTILITKP